MDADSTSLEDEILQSRETRPGAANRRAYVGPPAQYDFMGATQFNLLTRLGLREEHYVLDLGSGSLRAGRFLIPYLLPRRYIGVEPNSWLWQSAFEKELGQDVIGLKQPRFLDSDDFQLGEIDDESVDCVVAQSIYSHTGLDLFASSLKAAARVLTREGHMLFTIIRADDPSAPWLDVGSETSGWLYPGCVTFSEPEVEQVGRDSGLHLQQLDWFHPRQTWIRASKSPSNTLTPAMMTTLGTGKPLFDSRFE